MFNKKRFNILTTSEIIETFSLIMMVTILLIPLIKLAL